MHHHPTPGGGMFAHFATVFGFTTAALPSLDALGRLVGLAIGGGGLVMSYLHWRHNTARLDFDRAQAAARAVARAD